MRHVFSLLLLLMTAGAAAAQDPQQQPPDIPAPEQQQIEEEFVRTRSGNGESHASGARPELGPVVLGNPTTTVVALRVGLHASTFTPTGTLVTEFASLHHTFVELTNTDGDVKVIDRSTGKQITVMTPGSRIRVEHDGTSFLVTQDLIPLVAVDGPVFFRLASAANLFQVGTSGGFSAARRFRSIASDRWAGGATAGLNLRSRQPDQHRRGRTLRPGVVANEPIAASPRRRSRRRRLPHAARSPTSATTSRGAIPSTSWIQRVRSIAA